MRSYRWPLFVLTVLALVAAGLVPLRAQNDAIPPEVNALFDDIADIDKLRVLNPLKLTADQIDKITAEIKKSQKEYDKALAEATVQPIKGIASDVKDVRKKMLAGA